MEMSPDNGHLKSDFELSPRINGSNWLIRTDRGNFSQIDSQLGYYVENAVFSSVDINDIISSIFMFDMANDN
jgi:hypothetical protein